LSSPARSISRPGSGEQGSVFSKTIDTVAAAFLIAARRTNTLVLVHRAQLPDQWRGRLAAFLDLSIDSIGQIGAGKSKTTGMVDVAIIQSLYRKREVKDLVAEYGHIVVDECHHLSAVSFEQVMRRVRAKYVTGLTIGEGFEDSRLDTLFLAMPISWHGTLQQYVGRLHRLHDGKKIVEVYDYVDASIPMLARMFEKRSEGTRRLGIRSTN
jgi:superfamily II DNA or RNA helicase